MSGTCIDHIMKASVRPCLGHGIGIETSASVRHVWDMHRPQDISRLSSGIPSGSKDSSKLAIKARSLMNMKGEMD
ncbi:UvrABC system C [Gossypium arboreum]|uniref:UvrABC system C n=1 Tax=Gossypium arboreum TaxID=29729 RepID=A0A0B0P572_GOSAR|nr:UvrABC system C [Gossypium arboreum]